MNWCQIVKSGEFVACTFQPDLMVYGGDIVEGSREDGNLDNFEKIFKGIRTKYGSFAVLGNHEFYGRQDKGIPKNCQYALFRHQWNNVVGATSQDHRQIGDHGNKYPVYRKIKCRNPTKLVMIPALQFLQTALDCLSG